RLLVQAGDLHDELHGPVSSLVRASARSPRSLRVGHAATAVFGDFERGRAAVGEDAGTMTTMSGAAVQETAPTAVRRRPPSWVAPALLFVVAVTVYSLTIAHGVISLDVWSANFGSWHLARTGNPWIEGIRIPLLDSNPLRHEWVLE